MWTSPCRTWSCAWWKNLLRQMEDLGDFRRGTISEDEVMSLKTKEVTTRGLQISAQRNQAGINVFSRIVHHLFFTEVRGFLL